MKRSFAALTLILFLGIVYLSEAHAWWDGKWKHRIKVQFDASATGADVKDTITDVPVLVRLHEGNFSFSDANEAGADLRFIDADDKTPLKYHIEKFDPIEGIALLWVKVPRIRGGSNQDSVWMYYGNPSATDGQDVGGTYDVNHVAVFHLNEKDGNPRDATAYGNHAAVFTGETGLPSIVGTGAQFDGTGAMMTVSKSASLDFTKGFTFSAWARLNQQAGKAVLLSWHDDKQSLDIGVENGRVFCSLGQTTVQSKAASLSADKWYHLAAIVEPGKQVSILINGSQVATSPFKGAIPLPTSDINIGAAANGQSAFAGDLDEIQLSNIPRALEWIRAAYQSQGPDGLLTSYGESEAGSGSGESLTIALLRVVVRTITLDAWIVIGLLFFMGAAAVYIFGRKLTLIREAKKENELFSRSFRSSEHLLSLIEKNEEFPGSPLYRVYRAGCEELALLLERKSESFKKGKKISDIVLNGLRAAIDKAAIDESRKLSAGLVVMNVSISGGPFLGLLGTVWGVMNTFASLAESGEASLTAIAPGVASALSCTLGGLLVALPALFGSSYLTSHIKDVNADVNLFLDDFMRRLEEEQEDVS